MPTTQRFTVTMPANLIDEINARAQKYARRTSDAELLNRSGTLTEMVSRYINALAAARADLTARFTAAECEHILSSLRTAELDRRSIHLTPHVIADKLPGFSADAAAAAAYADKLKHLSYIECAALVDAVERWINADDPKPPAAELLTF